jgi:hypothetical protein
MANSVSKDVEKPGHMIHIDGDDVKCASTLKQSCSFSNYQTWTCYVIAMPLLGIYPRVVKICVFEKPYPWMFTAE